MVKQDTDIKDRKGSQPAKYYAGKMKKSTKSARAKHFEKGSKMSDDNPKAYKDAPGDKTGKTKPSKHTIKFKKMYGEVKTIEENKKGLQNKAEKSGISYSILKKVYDRGMAAWRTGHRPGTTPEQWGMARVNSFITKGSGTWGKADADLAKKVRGESVSLEEDVKSKNAAKSIEDYIKKDKKHALGKLTKRMHDALDFFAYELKSVGFDNMSPVEGKKPLLAVDRDGDLRNHALTMLAKHIGKTKVQKKFGKYKEFQFHFRAEMVESRMKELHGYIEQGKSAQWIAKKMKLDVKTIQSLMPEEIPANHTGSNVAGTGSDSSVVVPNKLKNILRRKFDTKTFFKKKKDITESHDSFAGHPVFHVDNDTFANCREGKRKFARWEKYIDLKSTVGQQIRDYAYKYPKKSIIIRNEDGAMIYLKGKQMENAYKGFHMTAQDYEEAFAEMFPPTGVRKTDSISSAHTHLKKKNKKKK